MVPRLGIGATTASAVIFSVLLVSNLVVFAAAQGRERHYAQADAEDFLADEASLLMGAGATDMLLQAQALLSSQTFDCRTALATVAGDVGAFVDFQSFRGVVSTSVAGVSSSAAAGDNLSVVAPYNGSRPGDLDLSLRFDANGRDNVTGVSFSKIETHRVHLPVRLQSMAADCTWALDLITRAVAAASGTNCTMEAVAPIIQGASQTAASRAVTDGFLYEMTYSVFGGASCTVTFDVSLEQAGVEGPGGAFSVRVEGGGSASFSPPAS